MSTSLITALSTAIESGLQSIPETERESIYVVSLFIYDDEDDPRQPTLTLGYNTVEQWRSNVDSASSSAEAKWNYAFWLQNTLATFGEGGTPSGETIRSWIRALWLWYSDEDEQDNFERCMRFAQQITDRFVSACCDAVAALHADGVVVRLFGRSIPLLVHELEYYDQIATQNELANPPGLCAEFVSWITT